MYNYCNENFPLKSEVAATLFDLVTPDQEEYEVTNISKIPSDNFSSWESCYLQLQYSSNITNNYIMLKVGFFMYCNISDKSALENLYCSINGDWDKPLFDSFHKGLPIGVDPEDSTKYIYRFDFNELLETGGGNMLFLHFFFGNDQTETNYTFTIKTTVPNGFRIDVFGF